MSVRYSLGMEELAACTLENDNIHVRVAGRDWHLHRTANLEDLWNALDEDDFNEDHMPYWTELWPASIALTHFLAGRRKEIEGRRCLDLGCGLGLTAIAGQWLGARTWAIDLEECALKFARENATLNDVSQPVWLAMDWRAPAFLPKSFWRVWAGDVLYEKRYAAPVLDLLEHSLCETGVAWFAEPGRKIFDFFLTAARARGWGAQKVFEGGAGIFPDALGGARIWELVPPPHAA